MRVKEWSNEALASIRRTSVANNPALAVRCAETTLKIGHLVPEDYVETESLADCHLSTASPIEPTPSYSHCGGILNIDPSDEVRSGPCASKYCLVAQVIA